MELVKDRSLVEGQRVKVYQNWSKGYSIFSILDANSGLVVAYSEHVTLKNVSFKVYRNLLLKCRENHRKSVHAWAQGEFVAEQKRPQSLTKRVYYDPYNVDKFVLEGTDIAISHSDLVHFEDRRAWILDAELLKTKQANPEPQLSFENV